MRGFEPGDVTNFDRALNNVICHLLWQITYFDVVHSVGH